MMATDAMTAAADSGDELVLQARTDREALGQLYDRHYASVLRYCIHRLFEREAAEDVTSTVFLEVARQIRSFTGKTEQDFANWLYAIATNHSNAAIRTALRHRQLLDQAVQKQQIRLCIDGDQEIERRLDWPRLHEAIAGLDPREQAVITLRSFEELPYERIATVVGVHTGTARVIYHRALKKLRAALGETAEDA